MSNLVTVRSGCLVSVLVLSLAGANSASADRYRTTQHNFGGVGLLQTPTARMAPEGSFSFNANRTEPYSRYSISMQPLPWMEGTLRYIAITNRDYSDSEEFSGDQSYKDKAIDFKFRLLKEGYWLPDLSVGFRDLAGTGLFSSEFVVANKRFYDLDFSLGVAWGYIGNRGDFSNPLTLIGDDYNERNAATVGTGGDFSIDNYFRGRPSVFGGVEYQSPWDPLRFKIELDGNDYQTEPFDNNQEQDSPLNFGVVYRLTDTVDVTAAWERGNTAMFGITLHTNLKSNPFPPKLLDPKPVERQPLPTGVSGEAVDWAKVSGQLENNAGFAVEHVKVRKRELIVTGEQTKYRDQAQGLGRASRILDNATGDSYDWYTLVNKPRGIAVSEASIDASKLRDLEENRIDEDTMRRSTVLAAPSELDTQTLHTEPLDKFTYGLSLGYNQNVGGPDDFILYQFLARLTSEYRFNRNQWLHGSLGVNLLNNFDEFDNRGTSELPQVRTNIREYLITSNVVLENLQYTQTKRLSRDVYAIGYGGLLESMFGGLGGEVLYRPNGGNWALGVDANWVRQRGFEQDLSFRDYSVFTGHVTAYMQTNIYDVLAKVSAGQYLAGDRGGTLELARSFDNGVTVGAWATRTNVSAEQFGEGSFDKGIYFTIPFDAFFARSTLSKGTISWSPLTRDGGARLSRYYQLYDLTSASDTNRFNDGFNTLRD
ncbi:YjbH domain-containing protein [Halopseudomonas laoshanensis]|uniref:YjbH domain-containing protein n=1 Tax=Halopseudomonas laoshanensis TaxID=2268758 RepID=A0A7V7GN65_9GAMM|nr:YjbH domain-containing protein [Halopseudomonas laoshanensis]KAA0690822.1 YjbH domain-containing protein [Halopseudomonas laoshanensis]